jgi:hypothetical protein
LIDDVTEELPEDAEAETSDAGLIVEPEQDLPPWLADLPQTSEDAGEPESLAEGVEIEAELEMPAWLSQLPAAPGAEESRAEAEEELPAWLADLPAATEGEAVAEAEVEMPAWLGELPEASAAEAAPVEEAGAEAELEIPSWLSELPAAPEAEVTPAEPVEEVDAELEMPSLGQLPAAPEVEESAAAEIEENAEEALVIPSWLTGIAGAAAAGVVATEMAETAETEAEEGTPAWLADLPEAIETEAPPTELAEEIATEAEAEFEIPSWLSELPETPPAEPAEAVEPENEPETPALATPSETAEIEAAVEAESEGEAELEIPAWLTGVAGAAPATVTAIETPSTEEAPEIVQPEPPTPIEPDVEADEVPSWLADLSTEDLKLPSWLSDTPAFAAAPTTPAEVSETEIEPEPPAEQIAVPEVSALAEPAAPETTEPELPAESAWLVGLDAATAAVQAAMPAEKEAESTLFTTEVEPEQPLWLQDTPKTAEAGPAATAPDEAIFDSEEEPEAPDWLKDLSDAAAPPVGGGLAAEALSPPAESKLSPGERMSDWLRGLQPGEERLADEDDKVAESTGVLAGLGPLLPIEKIAAPTSLLDPQATASTAQADALVAAARHFQAIATQAPQPAVLPERLTRSDQLMGNIGRGLLYLIFISLVALPLIPGFQKIDRVTNQEAAWTEPAGTLSEVLDKQRRELTSAQLGAIDLQQPGSVALVSFDYSAATQGEMQPLAEAIIGRLRGQGVRLIFISLEPEGATLAQNSVDQILTERGEEYGVDMVNLGYVPGQIAGIRELVSGRKQLSMLPDFKQGLTLAAPERAAWSGINNLGQVDVVITLSDNPATARWWVEQMATAIPPDDGERYLLAASSANADPFLRPYLDSQQLDGLISGINGAAAIEALGRKNFGPARQMLDSQGMAHLLIVILIALGTMVGWMPPTEQKPKAKEVVGSQ